MRGAGAQGHGSGRRTQPPTADTLRRRGQATRGVRPQDTRIWDDRAAHGNAAKGRGAGATPQASTTSSGAGSADPGPRSAARTPGPTTLPPAGLLIWRLVVSEGPAL